MELNDDCYVYEPLTELLPCSEGLCNQTDLSSEEDSDSETVSLDVCDVEIPNDTTVSEEFCATPYACNVLLKQFSVRHNITQDALSDLLELLNIYSEKQWPTSVYVFNKQFSHLLNIPINHYFCSYCYHSLPNDQVTRCLNEQCENELNEKGDISSFIELPLQPQFRKLMQHM